MNNEEFKNKVRTVLCNAGFLTNNDESIFSCEKVIQSETEDSLMLVGPNRDVWVWVGAVMSENEFNDAIEQYERTVQSNTQNISNSSVQINPALTVKEFLEGLAKMFGGKAPTEKIGTTKLSELINEAMTPVNE